ncbi:MAG: TatD family hydrolase [Candidatus Hydrothermarchaeota archaeon]|nr:TatD family hydrolase [Candidatus Hydrothermarchaeota archaeon]
MYFDAHIHADVRSYEDFEAMARAGVEKAVTCAHDVYRMTTSQVYLDHYDRLVRIETKLAARAGIELYVALGVHPSAIPEDADFLLEQLPELLKEDKVVAIGETGLELKDEREPMVLKKQLEMAKELGMPIIIHTPKKEKGKVVEEILKLVDKSGIKLGGVMIDHLRGENMKIAMDSGVYLGLSIQPPSKLSVDEAVGIVEKQGSNKVIISSDMSSIPSDPLALPRCALKLRSLGVPEAEVCRATYKNAAKFFKL